ncbi:transcriptional regulator PhoU [Basilea psittacipulmonis DSM 24701]|uniref:Phosphate-specific transport system accessory protein PhoU n=2 Tax=Basilea TaxID=1472344 RepID=A0A077DI28_9BURK|nr:transcriptional regulator PhoU [Basilea psittacipulmonis DSM 24701]
MVHYNSRFDNELSKIYSQFLEMGGLVEAMINGILESLSTKDDSVIEQIYDLEERVNNMEVEIDNAIIQLFALFQPTAVDLRGVIMVSKMNTDLERMGDEAYKIAKMIAQLHEKRVELSSEVDIEHMASMVKNMLRQVLDAFARRDPIAAAEVLRSDKSVDKEWKGIMRELITYMIEDPRNISASIDMIFIGRSFERIGDHCTNMAEGIIYIVQGSDVRHKKVKKAEKVARREAPGTKSGLTEEEENVPESLF